MQIFFLRVVGYGLSGKRRGLSECTSHESTPSARVAFKSTRNARVAFRGGRVRRKTTPTGSGENWNYRFKFLIFIQFGYGCLSLALMYSGNSIPHSCVYLSRWFNKTSISFPGFSSIHFL